MRRVVLRLLGRAASSGAPPGIGVIPSTAAVSVQDGVERPAAEYAAANADRSSSRCRSLTRVTPALRIGSVQENRVRHAAPRKASIRVRSSVKWTALTGVTRGWSGSSVMSTVTVPEASGRGVSRVVPLRL